MSPQHILRRPSAWRDIKDCPPDTAVLLYVGWFFEVGHYNSVIGAWLSSWDHRRLGMPDGWEMLPEEPQHAKKAPIRGALSLP